MVKFHNWIKKKWSVEMAEDYLENIECPICMDAPPGEEVHVCENGHYLCGICVKGVDKNHGFWNYREDYNRKPKCPMCRSFTVERNKLCEKLKRKAYKVLDAEEAKNGS